MPVIYSSGRADHDAARRESCKRLSYQTNLPYSHSRLALQAGDALLEVGRGPLPRVRRRCPEELVEGYARPGEARVPAWKRPSRVRTLQSGEESWHMYNVAHLGLTPLSDRLAPPG